MTTGIKLYAVRILNRRTEEAKTWKVEARSEAEAREAAWRNLIGTPWQVIGVEASPSRTA